MKLQLISAMITFSSSKSHGKLKRLALALPPEETVAIFLRSEAQTFDEDEQATDEELTARKPSLAAEPTKKLHAGKGWLKAKSLLQKINISKYRQLIRSSPLDPKGYVSLGKLYLKHNRLKESIGLFRSAIRLKDVNLQARPFSPHLEKFCYRFTRV